MPPENNAKLKQEFSQYLSDEVMPFAAIEKSALEKIIKIIFTGNVISQRNFVDYFKQLIKYMKMGIRVQPEDRVFMLSTGGKFVYYPIGIHEQGSRGNYASNPLLALYFRGPPEESFVIYDFGYRQ